MTFVIVVAIASADEIDETHDLKYSSPLKITIGRR